MQAKHVDPGQYCPISQPFRLKRFCRTQLCWRLSTFIFCVQRGTCQPGAHQITISQRDVGSHCSEEANICRLEPFCVHAGDKNAHCSVFSPKLRSKCATSGLPCPAAICSAVSTSVVRKHQQPSQRETKENQPGTARSRLINH